MDSSALSSSGEHSDDESHVLMRAFLEKGTTGHDAIDHILRKTMASIRHLASTVNEDADGAQQQKEETAKTTKISQKRQNPHSAAQQKHGSKNDDTLKVTGGGAAQQQPVAGEGKPVAPEDSPESEVSKPQGKRSVRGQGARNLKSGTNIAANNNSTATQSPTQQSIRPAKQQPRKRGREEGLSEGQNEEGSPPPTREPPSKKPKAQAKAGTAAEKGAHATTTQQKSQKPQTHKPPTPKPQRVAKTQTQKRGPSSQAHGGGKTENGGQVGVGGPSARTERRGKRMVALAVKNEKRRLKRQAKRVHTAQKQGPSLGMK